jgi:hypothetical protein
VSIPCRLYRAAPPLPLPRTFTVWAYTPGSNLPPVPCFRCFSAAAAAEKAGELAARARARRLTIIYYADALPPTGSAS